jgi:glycyl-tRNA synthetase beta chain
VSETNIMKASLLVELLTEELPPKALRQLDQSFSGTLRDELLSSDLVAKTVVWRSFATPRRLAVHIPSVESESKPRSEIKKLMPVKVGMNSDGKPTPALLKRLEKEGLNAANAKLERKTEAGAEYVFLHLTVPGLSLANALQSALEQAIAKLPIPKVMSYQLADGQTTVQFVRPAHGLIALHGDKVVDVSVLGLKAVRITHGHRFQGVKDIPIATADAYEEALAAHGKVIAAFETRRAETERQLREKAKAMGASLGSEEDIALLLDEVTALVEYPTVYAGEFEREFLAVPQECLILTMRANQKYFPLFDKAGKVTNKFLIVSNMELKNPKNIVEGNQRVVRPRLEDARFFFNQDRKQRLEERIPQLAKVVYHNKLGSQLDRVQRIKLLAGKIARLLGADTLQAERAAELAKADLLTGMVGEFPELQGIMGRYYALHDKEPAAVADAIEAHYRPRFAGDTLPEGPIACAVALADKLDTLAGLFSIGEQPTGDKDPFGLRRAALGVVRIVVENQLTLSVWDLVSAAFEAFKGKAQTDLQMFFTERMRSYFLERGYSANEVEAVLSLNPVAINLIPKQLEAVRAFSALPEAASLAAANKRIANILRQAQTKGESFADADVSALKEPAEISLFEALQTASRSAKPLFDSGDFAGYLKTFASLKGPVDSFFDTVMVMADDKKLRENRLALLTDMRKAMNRFSDISKLAA